MRAILVFVCFVSLALAGCGSDDNNPNGGTGNTPGTGGTGNMSGSTGGTGNTSGGGDCQTICESPCVDEVGLDQMELEACIEACGMGAFDPCLAEAAALIECVEQFENCEPTGANCFSEASDFATCFGFSF